jgi:hypothetical protein
MSDNKNQTESWTPHARTGRVELRDYQPGEDLSSISVSDEDDPQPGGKIARNPDNPEDQWYVSEEYYRSHYAAQPADIFEKNSGEGNSDEGSSQEGISQPETAGTIEIEIPAVVSPDGRVNAGLYMNEDGENVTDVGVLYDAWWQEEDTPLALVKVHARIDLDSVFADRVVEGEAKESDSPPLYFLYFCDTSSVGEVHYVHPELSVLCNQLSNTIRRKEPTGKVEIGIVEGAKSSDEAWDLYNERVDLRNETAVYRAKRWVSTSDVEVLMDLYANLYPHDVTTDELIGHGPG